MNKNDTEDACRECGGTNLHYSPIMETPQKPRKEAYYYYTCNSCGHEGKKQYNLSYTEGT